MQMDARTMGQVIADIIAVTRKEGFIYALLMIIRRDTFLMLEEYHMVNNRDVLITEEIKLLLGFWLKNESGLRSYPNDFQELSELKREILILMEELHRSFLMAEVDKLNLSGITAKEQIDEMFPLNIRIREAIFYGGDNLYDYEYKNFLYKKYKYDAAWLKENKGFICEEAAAIAESIKDIVSVKNSKVPHIPVEMKQMLHECGESGDEWFSDFIEYSEILAEYFISEDVAVRQLGIKVFCDSLLQMFCVGKSELDHLVGADQFLTNFSCNFGDERNEQYIGPGSFNKIEEAPMIKIDNDKYFIPITYAVFNAIYDAPFYWMNSNDKYRKKAGTNRGNAGEDIAYEILSPIFGTESTYKNIVIKDKHHKDITDIDVLCIYGNKALCVQIKSKRLTLLSKKGDWISQQNDFKLAVQNAYEQGLICKHALLDTEDKVFVNKETNKELSSLKSINEVFILCLTTENYPALTSQVSYLLPPKADNQPAIAFSVFDLALIAHYLNTPYDFLYYIRQRLATYKVFFATNEIIYLGYHLLHKLWNDGTRSLVILDDEYAQCIDRNYYPQLIGVDVSDEGDRIANRWVNEEFRRLCNDISKSSSPQKTDVLFALYDLSSDCVDELFKMMRMARERSRKNRTVVTLTMVLDGVSSLRGISYTANSLEPLELFKEMECQCKTKKYQAKADEWLSLGSNVGTTSLVDALLYIKTPWKFDSTLEWACEKYASSHSTTTFLPGKALGRNDLCYCGSGLKYKKCHGAK